MDGGFPRLPEATVTTQAPPRWGLSCVSRYTCLVANDGFRFSEEEQREIIQDAARLQREEGDALDLEQLTRAAAEAGIEPKFVEEAIRRRHTSSLQKATERRLPKAVAPILLVAQLIGVVIATMGGSMWEYGGAHWIGLMLIAFAWGCVGGGTAGRFKQMLIVGAKGTLIIAAVSILAVRLIAGPLHQYWPTYLMNLALAELVMILAGSLLAGVIEKSAQRSQLSRLQ
jgi:hypothetical protein